MPDSSVAVTPGTGANVDTFTQASGDHRQAVVLGDATTASTQAVDTAGRASVVTPSSFATGTITAANANTTSGTATAGSSVQITAPDGHSSWAIYVSGTFSAGTTLLTQGSLDGTNWFALNGRRNTDAATNDMTSFIAADFVGGPSPGGANPSAWRGNLGAVRFFRVTASTFTLLDSVSVQVSSSAAVGPTFFNTAAPATAPGTNAIGFINDQRAATNAVTATAAAATAVTLTIPAAAAGLFTYVTHLEVTLYSTAARTGVATPITVTTTNLAGAPAFTFATAAAIGTADKQLVGPDSPLKTTAAATATTVVAPAVTGALWRLTVFYFVAA